MALSKIAALGNPEEFIRQLQNGTKYDEQDLFTGLKTAYEKRNDFKDTYKIKSLFISHSEDRIQYKRVGVCKYFI